MRVDWRLVAGPAVCAVEEAAARPTAVVGGPGIRSSTVPSCGPGQTQATCHQLRHTCLIRVRDAGMALEAMHAQVGMPRSSRPASTRTWPMTGPASQYSRAAEAIDAQTLAGKPIDPSESVVDSPR